MSSTDFYLDGLEVLAKSPRVETQGVQRHFLRLGITPAGMLTCNGFINVMLWKGLVIASDINVRLYAGFGGGYN